MTLLAAPAVIDKEMDKTTTIKSLLGTLVVDYHYTPKEPMTEDCPGHELDVCILGIYLQKNEDQIEITEHISTWYKGKLEEDIRKSYYE